MTIVIESIPDPRGHDIKVGDMVVYAGPPVHHRAYEDEDGQLVNITRRGDLRFSKVKSILGDDYGGWAEAGRKIYVELEDGHKTWGDSENGGYGIMRLSEPKVWFDIWNNGNGWAVYRITQGVERNEALLDDGTWSKAVARYFPERAYAEELAKKYNITLTVSRR